jgi:hypothetical protein
VSFPALGLHAVVSWVSPAFFSSSHASSAYMFQLWSADEECVRFLTFFLDGTSTEKKWVFFFFFTAEA